MAEPVGLASGLLALATFAFKSSVALYETIQGFKSHQQRVRELAEELSALSEVLGGLESTAKNHAGVNLSNLEIPLRRCGEACEEFRVELLKCSSRSSASHTSFRDWAKLRYMGEDIDGFRRRVGQYKMTVTIALTDATLRQSTATTESLESYNELLNTAREELEERLETIDEKLERILERSKAETEQDAGAVRQIKEERESTEKCLQICSQLSDHIKQIQLAARNNAARSSSASSATAEDITYQGLEECKKSLARTVQRLKAKEKEHLDQLMNKLKTATADDRFDLERLRREWEAARESAEICSSAQSYLDDSASSIDNYATGDAIQFMVSTSNKTIHGRNRGLGWRTKQVGGHMNDETLREIARGLSNIAVQNPGNSEHPASNGQSTASDAAPGDNLDAKFKGQYGEGFKLTSKAVASKSPISEPPKAR